MNKDTAWDTLARAVEWRDDETDRQRSATLPALMDSSATATAALSAAMRKLSDATPTAWEAAEPRDDAPLTGDEFPEAADLPVYTATLTAWKVDALASVA